MRLLTICMAPSRSPTRSTVYSGIVMARAILKIAMLGVVHAVTISEPPSRSTLETGLDDLPSGASALPGPVDDGLGVSKGSCTGHPLCTGDTSGSCSDGSQPSCVIYYEEASNLRIRRSIYDMPVFDQERYLRSVAQMMTGGPENSTFRKIAGVHGYPDYQCRHNEETFTMWHRLLMAQFDRYLAEAHLQLYGNRNIAVPYWSYLDGAPSGGPLIPADYSWSPTDKSIMFDDSLADLVTNLTTRDRFRSYMPNPQDVGTITHIRHEEKSVRDAWNKGVEQGPLLLPNVVYQSWLFEYWFQTRHVRPIVNRLLRLNADSNYATFCDHLEGDVHNVGHWIAGKPMGKHPVSATTPTFFLHHSAIELLNTKALQALGTAKSLADLVARGTSADERLTPFKHADGSDYKMADTFVDAEVECLDFYGTSDTVCWKYELVSGSRLAHAPVHGVASKQHIMKKLAEEDDTFELTLASPDPRCMLLGGIPSFTTYVFFVPPGKEFTDETAKEAIDKFTTGEWGHKSMLSADHDGVGIVLVNHFGGALSQDESNVRVKVDVKKTDVVPGADLYVYSVDDDAATMYDFHSFSMEGFLSEGCAEGTKIDKSWIKVEGY